MGIIVYWDEAGASGTRLLKFFREKTKISFFLLGNARQHIF